MRIVLNGVERDVPEEITVAQLLAHLKIGETGTAVAVDKNIVRRSDFSSLTVENGSRIEIIRAIGGG